MSRDIATLTAILEHLHSVRAFRVGAYAVVVHVSRLEKYFAESSYRRSAVVVLHALTKQTPSKHFLLANGDIVIITRHCKAERLTEYLTRLHKSYRASEHVSPDAPKPMDDSILFSWYSLGEQYLAFEAMVRMWLSRREQEKADEDERGRYLKAAADGVLWVPEIPDAVVRGQFPGAAALLDEGGALYGAASVPVRRIQAAKELHSGAVHLAGLADFGFDTPVMTARVEAITREMADAQGTEPLFHYVTFDLTATCDTFPKLEIALADTFARAAFWRQLVYVRSHDLWVHAQRSVANSDLAVCVPVSSLQLTSASALDMFLSQTKQASGAGKSRIILEIDWADMAAAEAPLPLDRLKSAGFRLSLRGVPLSRLSCKTISGLPVDFIHTEAHPRMGKWSPPEQEELRQAIKKLGVFRVIMSGCDNAEMLSAAQSFGVILFVQPCDIDEQIAAAQA